MDIAWAQEAANVAAETAENVGITGKTIIDAAKYIGAGICMGIGAIGPGVGEVHQANNPDQQQSHREALHSGQAPLRYCVGPGLPWESVCRF